MSEVIEFLKKNKNVDFATVDADGRPRVRPFEVLAQDDGALLFVTSNKKKVFAELKKNPYVEFTVTSPDSIWIRISGIVDFLNDLATKQKILDHDDFLKGIYGSADNPEYELIAVVDAKATFYSFTQPPREVKI